MPVFDAADVRARFAEFPAVLAGAIALYLELAPERIERLGTALASRDEVAARDFAHALRGSSANVGARELANFTGRIEHLVQGSQLDDACEQWPAVCAAWNRLRGALADSGPALIAG